MSLLSLSPGGMLQAFMVLVNFIKENLILCGIMSLSYVVFFVYNFMHPSSVDTEIYEADVLGSGLSSIITALLLVGLDEGSEGFSLASLDLTATTTLIAVVLFIYGLVLALCAFTKLLPKILVIVLGNSELDQFLNYVAIMLTDPTIEITANLLIVLGVPLFILFLVQRLRRKVH